MTLDSAFLRPLRFFAANVLSIGVYLWLILTFDKLNHPWAASALR
jgi:hypothetical protein